MNILDLLVLIPAIYFVVRGFRKGILIEIFTIIGLVLAITGCLKLGNNLMGHFESVFGKSAWLPYVTYVVSFLIIFFLIQMIGKLLEKVLKITSLNLANRILGALLGLVKVAFFISLIFWLSKHARIIPPEVLEQSFSYRIIGGFAPFTISIISDLIPQFHDLVLKVEDFFDAVK